jgi:integrase
LKEVLGGVKAQTKHHAAVDYAEMPVVVARVKEIDDVAATALRFLILTAVRTGEARLAEWKEVDFKTRIWTVPAPRTKTGKKTGRDHIVPLSPSAIALLESLPGKREGFVFARLDGAAIGEGAMWAVLKEKLGITGATVHGFRSSFRDWCGDCTSFPREIAEAALDHALPDATGSETDYRRKTAVEKRRRLMSAWAEYLDSKPVKSGDKVVAIGKHA